MYDINKRVITSIFLITLLILSIYNIYILSILLLVIILEIFFEIQKILKKIIKRSDYNYLYILLIFTLIYIVSIFIYVWVVFIQNNSQIINNILLIVLICISSDIGGYIFGNIFKGKKISKISPNKTYSGMIGSYILAVLFSYLFFGNQYDLNLLLIYTLVVSSISQCGDFFISYLKRKAKIKDTGRLLPGHGGFLDRLDGLIFALPIGLIFIRLV